MDPVTQGVLGATASQLVSTRREKVEAAFVGVISGMAADLDVLIKSATDPLLFLEYHRHFTHSLFFIPVGALVCAILYIAIARVLRKSNDYSRQRFNRIYVFSLAGYATHALLDACTTYGTQLLWPFTNTRFAWNTVSVIDPLFTLPLFIILAFSILRRSRSFAIFGALYVVSYLSLGMLQNQRALSVAQDLAATRGHTPTQLGVKPSFANILVWKSVYIHNDEYYVDAVRAGLRPMVYQGTKTKRLVVSNQFPWLTQTSQQSIDIERFRWFSNDHLGVDPNNPLRIIDVRYSVTPNRLDGMWGITLDPEGGDSDHVVFSTSRPKGDQMRAEFDSLIQMILGRPL